MAAQTLALGAVHFLAEWLPLCVRKKRDHPWFRSRGYAHFDWPISQTAAERLASDPVRVAAHAFWPLLAFRKRERLWKKGAVTPPPAPGPALLGLSPTPPSKLGKWKIKPRPIAYAAHSDSAIFAYYGHRLGLLLECELVARGIDGCVLAYRRIPRAGGNGGKSNYDFAMEAFADIAARDRCEVIAIDIKSFFDTIPHRHLKREWKSLLGVKQLPPDQFAVYRAATKFARVPLRTLLRKLGIGIRQYRDQTKPLVEPGEFGSKVRDAGLIHANTATGAVGIPQGLPISGVLANLVMLTLDTRLSRAARACGASYRRYSDDILFVAPCGAGTRLERLCTRLIDRMGMRVQQEKTTRHQFYRDGSKGCVSLGKPAAYLGFQFDGERVLLRPQTLTRFQKRVLRGVKTAGRIAGRNWDGFGSVRIRRRNLYNRFSPLPIHRRTPIESRPQGNFHGYARRASSAAMLGLPFSAVDGQMTRQLRRAMRRLETLIKKREARQTCLEKLRRGLI